MCGLAKRNFNILSRAGQNRRLFDIFDKEFVDRHCQSSVVDRLFVVESKFVNDIVAVSVKEVWWRCRSVLVGFMFVTDEAWRGCFQPCLVAFYSCRLSTAGCQVSVLVECWVSGVGVGCRVYLSVVVACCGCLVSLSMVVVGSWLSIVWCWLLIVGVDCRSFFPFVGAHLWLSENFNFLQVLLVASLDIEQRRFNQKSTLLTDPLIEMHCIDIQYSVFFYYSNLFGKVRRISELIDFYQTFEILYCRNISYGFVCNPCITQKTNYNIF